MDTMDMGLTREQRLPKMNLSKIRLDRSLTTAIFHPLERAGLACRSSRLPILMYHSLSANPENGVAAYYKTNTDPLVFRQQMRYLAAEGYKTMELTQVIARLQNN